MVSGKKAGCRDRPSHRHLGRKKAARLLKKDRYYLPRNRPARSEGPGDAEIVPGNTSEAALQEPSRCEKLANIQPQSRPISIWVVANKSHLMPTRHVCAKSIRQCPVTEQEKRPYCRYM